MGKREKTGRNDGAHVEKYLKSVGLNPKGRYAYCQAGQYWGFVEAAKILQLPASCIPLLQTGGVLRAFNHAKKTGRKTPAFPQPKDLISWDYGKGKGHVERVTKVLKGGFVETDGFNTVYIKGGKKVSRDAEFNAVCIRNWAAPHSRMQVAGFTGHYSKEC